MNNIGLILNTLLPKIIRLDIPSLNDLVSQFKSFNGKEKSIIVKRIEQQCVTYIKNMELSTLINLAKKIIVFKFTDEQIEIGKSIIYTIIQYIYNIDCDTNQRIILYDEKGLLWNNINLISFATLDLNDIAKKYIQNKFICMTQQFFKAGYEKIFDFIDKLPKSMISYKLYDIVIKSKLSMNDKFYNDPNVKFIYKEEEDFIHPEIKLNNDKKYHDMFQEYKKYILVAAIKINNKIKLPKYLIYQIFEMDKNENKKDMQLFDESLISYFNFKNFEIEDKYDLSWLKRYTSINNMFECIIKFGDLNYSYSIEPYEKIRLSFKFKDEQYKHYFDNKELNEFKITCNRNKNSLGFYICNVQIYLCKFEEFIQKIEKILHYTHF